MFTGIPSPAAVGKGAAAQMGRSRERVVGAGVMKVTPAHA